MYCPSCSQTFSPTYKRCPECHCWLKSEEKTAAKAAQLSSGWSAPSAEVRRTSGHSVQEEVDDEYGWHADSAPPKPKPALAPVSEPDEEWIDRELETEADEISEARTIVVYDKPSGSSTAVWALLALVLVACIAFLGMKLYDNHSSSIEARAVDSSTNEEALQEAETWMKSADESLRNKDYDLAVAQLEKALALLKEGQAEKPLIAATAAKYAGALERTGKLEEAHKQWANLGGTEGKAKRAAVEKQLRIRANGLLEQSVAARKAKENRKALKLADEAHSLFKSYGGSKGQLADSLEAGARAGLADGNLVAAESKLQLAQKYLWSQTRADLMAQIAPRSTGSMATSRPTRRPTLGAPSNVPQGVRKTEQDYPQADISQTVVRRPPTVSQPVRAPVSQQQTAAPPTIQYQPPANSPAYNNSESSQPSENLGNEGVLETYKSSGAGKTGPPGYR